MTATLRSPEAPLAAGVALRPWRGLEDVDGMAAANGRLRRHLGILEPIEPQEMRHHYTHLVNSNPDTDCLLVEIGGSTAGYVRAEWHDLTDGDRVYDITLAVEPAAWGTGALPAMLAWAEARLREIAADHPSTRRAWYAAFAFEGDAELTGALEAAGYRKVRGDAEMLRPDLEDIEPVPVPAGYELRTPTDAELPAVWEMLIAAFAEHWGESEAEEQRYDHWVEDPRFDRDLVVVAWAGDQPAAVVCNVMEKAPDGSPRGLLDGVATHPGHRRRGLARAAIAESLRRLRDAGATSAYLGVDTENQNRALVLYETCGFRVASRSSSYRKPFPATEATT